MTDKFEIREEKINGVRVYVLKRKDNKSFNNGVRAYHFFDIENAFKSKNKLELLTSR